ncbi:hypothetical protein STCU_10912 [Strigomonas culicis]|uniref:Uncharacterized protein n=1 Tax=Strigomonas culicis TaxID=28005 RepID=S9TJ67_9TRYP|nr:hypothetical protein STCU_10912 [Strigomonas culicis]|eukprot:EPY16914.1 hypothetical protein STCU_10912 [Strigomonas culicis]
MKYVPLPVAVPQSAIDIRHVKGKKKVDDPADPPQEDADKREYLFNPYFMNGNANNTTTNNSASWMQFYVSTNQTHFYNVLFDFANPNVQKNYGYLFMKDGFLDAPATEKHARNVRPDASLCFTFFNTFNAFPFVVASQHNNLNKTPTNDVLIPVPMMAMQSTTQRVKRVRSVSNAKQPNYAFEDRVITFAFRQNAHAYAFSYLFSSFFGAYIKTNFAFRTALLFEPNLNNLYNVKMHPRRRQQQHHRTATNYVTIGMHRLPIAFYLNDYTSVLESQQQPSDAAQTAYLLSVLENYVDQLLCLGESGVGVVGFNTEPVFPVVQPSTVGGRRASSAQAEMRLLWHEVASVFPLMKTEVSFYAVYNAHPNNSYSVTPYRVTDSGTESGLTPAERTVLLHYQLQLFLYTALMEHSLLGLPVFSRAVSAGTPGDKKDRNICFWMGNTVLFVCPFERVQRTTATTAPNEKPHPHVLPFQINDNKHNYEVLSVYQHTQTIVATYNHPLLTVYARGRAPPTHFVPNNKAPANVSLHLALPLLRRPRAAPAVGAPPRTVLLARGNVYLDDGITNTQVVPELFASFFKNRHGREVHRKRIAVTEEVGGCFSVVTFYEVREDRRSYFLLEVTDLFAAAPPSDPTERPDTANPCRTALERAQRLWTAELTGTKGTQTKTTATPPPSPSSMYDYKQNYRVEIIHFLFSSARDASFLHNTITRFIQNQKEEDPAQHAVSIDSVGTSPPALDAARWDLFVYLRVRPPLFLHESPDRQEQVLWSLKIPFLDEEAT